MNDWGTPEERAVWRKEMGTVLVTTILAALFWQHRDPVIHNVTHFIARLAYRLEGGR